MATANLMRDINRRQALVAGLSGVTTPLIGSFGASAETAYPERPIKLVVPFVPGGVMDVVARLWADRITPTLGTIVIENRGGAAGTIGAMEVANASPDGYTILFGNTSTQLLDPMVMPRLGYVPERAFAAVSIVANSAISIAVNPSVPATNLKELITYIKAHPDKSSFGSPRTGTLTYLAGELFKRLAGVPNLVNVPYKGGGQSMTDLLGGNIPILLVNVTPGVLDLNKAGKIRIVAVFNSKRLGFLPGVETVTETIPNLVVSLFMGVFVPAAATKNIVDTIARAQLRLATDDEFKSRLEKTGIEPVLVTSKEAQKFMASEQQRLVSLISLAGLKLK